MDDIYEERPSHDYADGVAAGIILSRWLGGSSDGADGDGLSANNEALWDEMAPRRKGLTGIISGFVIIGTIIWSIAMIVALIICAFSG